MVYQQSKSIKLYSTLGENYFSPLPKPTKQQIDEMLRTAYGETEED